MANNNSNISLRLIIMNFLEFAVWGAYLTSMGSFLAKSGFGDTIWLFYATQGFVSIFMPALMGIVADKWLPAQKVLSLCQALSGVSMLGESNRLPVRNTVRVIDSTGVSNILDAAFLPST